MYDQCKSDCRQNFAQKADGCGVCFTICHTCANITDLPDSKDNSRLPSSGLQFVDIRQHKPHTNCQNKTCQVAWSVSHSHSTKHSFDRCMLQRRNRCFYFWMPVEHGRLLFPRLISSNHDQLVVWQDTGGGSI